MLAEKLSSISLGVRAKNWGSVEEEKPKLSSKLRAEMEPGVFITGRIRSLARSFPNQHHVVVEGLHFVQEDSPDEVGRAIAGWLQRI
jgi:hypothetical protein